jgi:hypothetical protein
MIMIHGSLWALIVYDLGKRARAKKWIIVGLLWMKKQPNL